MTFSIVGRCRRSGMLGVAITTSSICVGARCPSVRTGVGAVSSQNLTDPTLGAAVLDRLAAGDDAADALATVMDGNANRDHRQLIVVDSDGNTAGYSGARMLGVHADAAGDDCIAAGNLLANESVVTAITAEFERRAGDHLGERLLRAIEAGVAAGGEQGEVHSAALLVAHEQTFPLIDLRVDWRDHDPLGALRKLWHAYRPQVGAYLTRALDPDNAPSFNVPGDR